MENLWVIYNEGEKLYWSNEVGWVDLESATIFTSDQKEMILFLPGVGSKWLERTFWGVINEDRR